MDIERNDSSQNLSEKEAFEIVDRSKTEFINNFIKDHIDEYDKFKNTVMLKYTMDDLKRREQIHNPAKIQDVYTIYDKKKKEIKSKLISYSPSSWNQSKRECIDEDVINQILDKQISKFEEKANSVLEIQKRLAKLASDNESQKSDIQDTDIEQGSKISSSHSPQIVQTTKPWLSNFDKKLGAGIVVADLVIIYFEAGLPAVESLVTSLEITCISPYALYILGVVGISLGAWYVVSKCLN